MRKTIRWTMGAAALVLCTAAHATQVQGRLELQWGDPVRSAQGHADAQFRATLVGDDGMRIALDPAQALHAAENLYALSGRRIAVEFSPASTDVLPYAIDAIVAADAKSAGDKIAGTTIWRTILCKFSDVATEQKDLAFFNSQYGNSAGQLDNYWREVSYNKINLAGSSAHGWFVLPHPRAFYIPAGQSANLNQLFDDCTAAANPSVDFSTGGGVQGINMMFNGDLDGFAWGGGRCALLDGVNKCWSTTWNPPWSFGNLAPLSHEMGHGYGLPHANNSDGDSDPYDNPWDVMSDAWNNATSNPTYGTVAKHISTYSRDQLGFIDAARKRTISAGTDAPRFQLDRASLAGSSQTQMVVVRVPGEPDSRYYTIEARKRIGSYDGNLAGNAVIIHRVDTARGEPAWSVDATVPPANRANNEGSMFKVGERWTAPGNAFTVNVQLENANGFVISVCKPTLGSHRPIACNIRASTVTTAVPHGRPLDPSTPPSIPPCVPGRHCAN